MAQTTLPPPPYASAVGGADPRPLGGPQVYDRYGGGRVHPMLARTASAPGVPAYTGPRMAWSGKIAEAQAPAPVARAGWVPSGWTAVPARAPYDRAAPAARARLQYPSMGNAPAQSGPAPRWQQAQAIAPAPAPTSIYSAPLDAAPAMPPAPTRLASAAQASGNGPRLYSLHRDYGMEPDPIPIAPQFFGPTADLTTPETPEVGRRLTTKSGAPRPAVADTGSEP